VAFVRELRAWLTTTAARPTTIDPMISCYRRSLSFWATYRDRLAVAFVRELRA
jgi:hypothetical protein